MIPLQLALKNFLSYREANLDFTGLHTACICGANGAGKSSLLEAITWAMWGRSRAAIEDNAITHGAEDMRVDFTFQLHGSIYRIIRSRQRGGSGGLEMQVMVDGAFKSLTQKGIKATQNLIDDYLKIDYDTFTNSAYLRQGKADEFMLKKPAERKQILADLLKLDRYEALAEKARQMAGEYRAQAHNLQQQLAADSQRLAAIPDLQQQIQSVQTEIATRQDEQTAASQRLDALKLTAQQRQTYLQQIELSDRRQQELQQDLVQVQQDLTRSNLEIERLGVLLDRGDAIHQAHQQYQQLSAAVATWEDKARAYHQAQQQQQHLQLQQERQHQQHQREIDRLEQTLVNLDQQQQEQIALLAQAPQVTQALTALKESRDRLQGWDDLYRQTATLTKRRQELGTYLDKLATQRQARLEQVQREIATITTDLAQGAAWEAQLTATGTALAALEKQRVYLDRIRDKGQECSQKLAHCQAQQQQCQHQQQKLAEKAATLATATDATCPLCSHALEGDHWRHVLAQQEQEGQELQYQLTDLQAQEITLNRERDQLRQDYQAVAHQLKEIDRLNEVKGQLDSRLQTLADRAARQQKLLAEQNQLAQPDSTGDLQWELQDLEDHLKTLGYDEKSHSLARSAVDRYRWAEVRQGDLRRAAAKQQTLGQHQQAAQTQLAHLRELAIATATQDAAQLAALQTALGQIDYDPQQQQADQGQLRTLGSAVVDYQQWQQAQSQHPQWLDRVEVLRQQKHTKEASYQAAVQASAEIARQLAAMPDGTAQMAELNVQMADRRQYLDGQLATLGQYQAQLQELAQLQASLSDRHAQLQEQQQQQFIYEELTKAFGKNGIQALIVENILPEVEAEANRILSRLSNNQLHLQFVTQKPTKKSLQAKKSKTTAPKAIDTLDIAIGDANGTRPYENYSGGEAFRINFSVRLALAKLLSQRSGTPLQMLVVDEGFGTQDREGCDRLIAAINAVAEDFKCVLAVTHIPQFKEAFSTRIEVHKTVAGSQIEVFN